MNLKSNSPFLDLYGCQKNKREKISHPFPSLHFSIQVDVCFETQCSQNDKCFPKSIFWRDFLWGDFSRRDFSQWFLSKWFLSKWFLSKWFLSRIFLSKRFVLKVFMFKRFLLKISLFKNLCVIILQCKYVCMKLVRACWENCTNQPEFRLHSLTLHCTVAWNNQYVETICVEILMNEGQSLFSYLLVVFYCFSFFFP